MTKQMMSKAKLTGAQMSLVEIYILDTAHDEEREDWWPVQSGRMTVDFPADRLADVLSLVTDIANTEEDDMRHWRTAQGLWERMRSAA